LSGDTGLIGARILSVGLPAAGLRFLAASRPSITRQNVRIHHSRPSLCSWKGRLILGSSHASAVARLLMVYFRLSHAREEDIGDRQAHTPKPTSIVSDDSITDHWYLLVMLQSSPCVPVAPPRAGRFTPLAQRSHSNTDQSTITHRLDDTRIELFVASEAATCRSNTTFCYL